MSHQQTKNREEEKARAQHHPKPPSAERAATQGNQGKIGSKEKNKNQQQQQNRPPANCAPPEAEEPNADAAESSSSVNRREPQTVTEVLDAAGIHDADKRAQIASIDGIELVIIDLWRKASRRGIENPAGMLIRLIDTDAQSAIRVTRRDIAEKHRRAQAVRDTEAAEQEERQQKQQEWDRISRWAARLDDQTRKTLRDRAIANADPWKQGRWSDYPPGQEGRFLLAAMYDLEHPIPKPADELRTNGRTCPHMAQTAAERRAIAIGDYDAGRVDAIPVELLPCPTNP